MRASVRSSAGHALSAVLAVALAVPMEACGEILILKADAERVPCRVLFQDEQKIVVRVATGTERTFQMSEVADVIPETSNVEIYEGVAEIMPRRLGDVADPTGPRSGGILPFYLGVWCVRNDMLQNGRRLLGFAAGDPLWAGRAKFELAGTVKDVRRRRLHLFDAVAADPTLQEAVEALAEERPGAAGIPRASLLSLARAVQDACVGNNTRAYQKLQTIKAASTPQVLEALSSRLAGGTGIGFGELAARCGRGLSDVERALPGAEGGRTDCKNCGGSGFVVCELCGGKGYTRCKTCDGRGVVTSTKWRSDRRERIASTKRCPGCGGKSYRECRTCLRMPKTFSRTDRTLQVEEPCPTCRGEGLVPSRRKVTYTTRIRRPSGYTETVYVSCTRCSGRGSIVRSRDMRVGRSGWRRCPLCNKGGKIPFEGPPGMLRSSRYSRLTRDRVMTRGPRRTTADVRFTQDEVRRLKRFVHRLSYVTSGEADYLWRSGEKVPLRLSPPAAAAEDELFFADGKWVTKSMAKLRRQRARTLGYNPRKPDLSAFFEWLQKEDLAFLRKHSADIGEGAAPWAGVMGLVSYFERSLSLSGAAGGDAFDRARMFRTVFLPDSGALTNEKAACRWNVRRMMGEEQVSLVLLREPTRWPRLEIVATPIPDDGLNMGRLGEELLAGLGSPLTLYYRVGSCRRSSRGRGEDAVAHVSLDIRVAAAVIGHERRPKKAWIHGLEGLAAQSRQGRLRD